MYINRTDREKAVDYAMRVYPYEYEGGNDPNDWGGGRQKPVDLNRLLQDAEKFLTFLEADEVTE